MGDPEKERNKSFRQIFKHDFVESTVFELQSNLSTMTTQGWHKKSLLNAGGPSSQVKLIGNKLPKGTQNVVVILRWLLFTGGC